jgi:hypothetical protein
MTQELTEAERTKIVYSYFTLDEWKLISRALKGMTPMAHEARQQLSWPYGAPCQTELLTVMSKLPSAVL